MKKFILLILILLISIPGFAQYGQVGGGISGITLDGNTIVFGSPADSVIFEIPVSAEASFTFETLIGTSFKIFNAEKDTIIINPNGFSSSNSAVAGTAVFNYKSRGGHSVIIDSLSAYVSVMNSPTANAGLMQLGTSADADRFKVDEDGDVTNDGNITAGGTVSSTTYGSNGSVTDAELLFINTVTSNVQDQIDAIAASGWTDDGAVVRLTTSTDVVNIGAANSGTALQIEQANAYFTMKNVTDENTEGGAETRVIFEDHANVALAQIEGSHSGAADDTKGKVIIYTHTGAALTAALTIDDTQLATFAGTVVATGEARISGSATNLYLDHTSATADHDVTINFGDDGVNDAHRMFYNDGASRFEYTDDFRIGTSSAGLMISTAGQVWVGTVNVSPTITFTSTLMNLKSGSAGSNIQLDISPNAAGADGEVRIGDAGTAGEYVAVDSVGAVRLPSYLRMETTLFQDCFDYYVAAQDYADHWDISSLNVTGAGSNELTTESSHITLTTDGAGANETEGTKSIQAFVRRAEEPRSEFHVELGQTATTNYYCGWNTQATNTVAADDKFVLVVYEVGQANWQLWVDDGAGADIDKFVSAVAVTTGSFRFDIWSATDGTIGFSINGAVQTTGLSELMQADDHYLIVGQLQTTDGTAVNAAIDYIEMEKVKQ